MGHVQEEDVENLILFWFKEGPSTELWCASESHRLYCQYIPPPSEAKNLDDSAHEEDSGSSLSLEVASLRVWQSHIGITVLEAKLFFLSWLASNSREQLGNWAEREKVEQKGAGATTSC